MLFAVRRFDNRPEAILTLRIRQPNDANKTGNLMDQFGGKISGQYC